MMIYGVVLYLGGLISFSLNLKKILMMLLSLEYMMLSVFFLLINFMVEMDYMMILFFMVVSVCEASMGLGLLVLTMMMGGNEKFKSLDLIGW